MLAPTALPAAAAAAAAAARAPTTASNCNRGRPHGHSLRSRHCTTQGDTVGLAAEGRFPPKIIRRRRRTRPLHNLPKNNKSSWFVYTHTFPLDPGHPPWPLVVPWCRAPRSKGRAFKWTNHISFSNIVEGSIDHFAGPVHQSAPSSRSTAGRATLPHKVIGILSALPRKLYHTQQQHSHLRELGGQPVHVRQEQERLTGYRSERVGSGGGSGSGSGGGWKGVARKLERLQVAEMAQVASDTVVLMKEASGLVTVSINRPEARNALSYSSTILWHTVSLLPAWTCGPKLC